MNFPNTMKTIFSFTILFLTFNQGLVLAQVQPPIITGSSTTVCNGVPVTLTASGCSGTIQWNTGSTGSVITVTTAGTYLATCITVNGNSTSLPYPIETASSGTLTQIGNSCSNGSVLLQTSNIPPDSYPEYSRNGNFIPHINHYAFRALEAGTYTFTSVQRDISISGNQTTNTSLKINDIFFITASKGWAVGNGGLILSTNNGGQTWAQSFVSNSAALRAIFFLNEQTGWVAGMGGTLYKTTNGGVSWSLQSVYGVYNYDTINAVFFTDANNGWVAVSNRWFYKTTNGGISWNLVGGGGSSEMIDVFFANQSNGWILTDGFVRKTTDGGWTWNDILIENRISNHNRDFFFLNSNEGWIVGDNGYITHTTDGGLSWQSQLSNTNIRLNKIFFINNKEGWIVGENGMLLYTNDGGSFWIKKDMGSDKNFSALFFTNTLTGWVGGDDGVLRKITTSLRKYCPSNEVVIKASPQAPQVAKSACNSSNIVLTASGCAGLISWSNGATGTSVTVYSSGSYTAFCTVNGCRSVDSKEEIVNIGPSGNLLADNGTTCLNENPRLYVSGLGSEYSYEWRKNGIPFENGNNTDFRPTTVGTYEAVPYLKGEKTWEWQSPEIPVFSIYATAMSAPNKAWAVGAKGYVLGTEDGGTSWKYITIDPVMIFYDIQFVNEQIGYAVGNKPGSSNYLIKTTDGGKHWQKILMNNAPHELIKMFFLDENTGWAVGASRTIMKTTNGGLNWFFQSQDYYSPQHLNSIFFINATHGWATGVLGTILYTTDGGNSWNSQTSPDVFTSLNDVVFVNQQKGFAIGDDGLFLRTNDGGNNWKLDSAARVNFRADYQKAQFINENTGWIFGNQYVLNTIDGGATWGMQAHNLNGSYKIGGAFWDYQHGIVAGSGGVTIMTHDGGFSWKRPFPDINDRFKEVTFTDKYNGKVLGDSKIGFTNNGGKTWTFRTPFPEMTDDLFRDFHFVGNKGWLITHKKIYYSADGGINWTEQLTYGGAPNLTSVFFTDQNTGWVTGDAELLLKTTNGGVNWTVVPLPTHTITLTDIHFIGNKGWLIGEYGRMYYSDNAGATWTLQENQTESNLNDVFFINENVGWIATNTELLRTINGGISWDKYTFYTFDFSKVHFVTPTKGWALLGGQLATSYDGGASWTREFQSPNHNSSLFGLNEEEVIVVSFMESIQKFYNIPTYYCPTNSITISNPTPPTLSTFTNIICQNKTLTLTATNCTGTINWSNGRTGSSITINAAGTYTATCTTNNCPSGNSNAIQITSAPNCNAITIAPGNVYACPNKPLTLTASGCPGNSVVWSNNMTGSAIQVSLSAAATIEAFCQSGGSQTVSISIAVDDLTLTNSLQGGEHFFQVNKNIQSSSKISTGGSNAKVDYVSGKSIVLQPGFEVSQQNLFKAEIKTCQN